MGFYEGAMKVAKEIATGIWGDGAAHALKADMGSVGHSRVMQKETSALQSLMSTMKANGVTFEDDIAKNIDLMSDGGRAGAVNALTGGIKEGDIGKDPITKAIDNYKNGGDKLETYIKNTGPDSESMRKAASEYLGKEDGSIGMWNMASGYFLDAENGHARRVAGAAAVGGAGIAMRYLSGGNLTTTAQGERNIAGIPFI